MNTKFWVRLVTIVLLTSLVAGWITLVPGSADGQNTLAPSFNYTLQGDVITAGVGLRGTGAGTISLAGLPAGASVYRAFLYWATLGSANTYHSPTLNGQPVAGRLIGTTGDTCWDVQNNFVYRADVTTLVTGNGAYALAGLPNSLLSGNDSQGASLVVIYTDPSQPFRTFVINDGAVALNFSRQTFTDTINNFTPDAPLTQARVTYLVGDGQAQWEAGSITFNGTPIASGVFSGVDGDFWGTHTFDVTGLVSSDPATTTLHNNVAGNPQSPDCLLWAATIFSVTASVPEGAGNSLTQSLNLTLIGDVTAAGVGLRGSGAGTLVISGVPDQAIVVRAYLYWATLGNSSRFTAPRLNGTTVAGELIGISADTCWGVLQNYVYRADVNPLVNGNGDYAIAGLPNGLATGNDTQGASLVVIYASPGLHRTVVINDGAVTLDFDIHTYTDTLTGFTADQPMAQTRITYLIGDGQSEWDTGAVMYEGHPIAQNVFTGVDGEHWGTLTFDVTGLTSEPDATTTISNLDPDNPISPDCLLWAATVFSVQTEPFPWQIFLPLVLQAPLP